MPPPAPGLRSALQRASEALSLDFGGDSLDALLQYLSLLQRWNGTYNLTSVRDPAQMLSLHLADCLAVMNPLRRQLAAQATARLLDVGSGAGLPGAVIEIGRA